MANVFKSMMPGGGENAAAAAGGGGGGGGGDAQPWWLKYAGKVAGVGAGIGAIIFGFMAFFAIHHRPAVHCGRHLANPGRLYRHPHRSSVHVHVPRLRPVFFADGRWEARVAESGSISGFVLARLPPVSLDLHLYRFCPHFRHLRHLRRPSPWEKGASRANDGGRGRKRAAAGHHARDDGHEV